MSLADYRGTTVYLDFWSSWCLPCRESLPLLGELEAKLKGQDFAVVGVNLDVHPRDGRSIMEKFDINYPVASDITGRVADQYGLKTLPAAFLINGDGIVEAQLPLLDEQNFSAIYDAVYDTIAAAESTATAAPTATQSDSSQGPQTQGLELPAGARVN